MINVFTTPLNKITTPSLFCPWRRPPFVRLSKFKSLFLPQDVGVGEFVHELYFLQHVGPVGAVLVHLQDHHLPRRLVSDLESKAEMLGKWPSKKTKRHSLAAKSIHFLSLSLSLFRIVILIGNSQFVWRIDFAGTVN